jgi:phage terminase Nu1 subunit (DNA packaging protein)
MADERKVTQPEIADLIDVSEREIIRLTQLGILVRGAEKRGGRARVVYNERLCVRAYVRYLRKPADDAKDSFMREKAETQRLIRAQKELELGVATGALIPKERVLRVVGGLISTMKNHVLAIASRCSRLLLGLTTVAEIHTLLTKYLELALREMSDFDDGELTNTQKQGKNGERKRRKAKARR